MTQAIDAPARPSETVKLMVRATPQWVAWLDEQARRDERTRSSLLAAACQAYAQANGLAPPPSRV